MDHTAFSLLGQKLDSNNNNNKTYAGILQLLCLTCSVTPSSLVCAV